MHYSRFYHGRYFHEDSAGVYWCRSPAVAPLFRSTLLPGVTETNGKEGTYLHWLGIVHDGVYAGELTESSGRHEWGAWILNLHRVSRQPF